MKENVTSVLLRLFLKLPCTYLMITIFFIFLTVKIFCCSDISLLVSLVTVTANFEAIALIVLASSLGLFFANKLSESLDISELEIIHFTPYPSLCLFALLNVCVTFKYIKAIRSPVNSTNSTDQEAKVYSHWRKKTCVLHHYIFSFLVSFHNTCWLNSHG